MQMKLPVEFGADAQGGAKNRTYLTDGIFQIKKLLK
jgi:hypothetical protein